MRSITAPFLHSSFHPKTIFTHQGFFAPQLEQKLPLFPVLQEAQTQLVAGAAAGSTTAGASTSDSLTSAPGTQRSSLMSEKLTPFITVSSSAAISSRDFHL